MSFYDYTLKDWQGNDVALDSLRGKVVLVVNTAYEWGFTAQYGAIEKIYEKCRDKGFEVLDIPCNQFGAQAPGTDEEIHAFRVKEYGAQYPQMKKSDVNGENALPLYGFLKSQKGFAGFGEGEMADKLREVLPKFDPDYENNAEIKWNFTKFVIDREGNVVERFEPTANIGLVAKCVSQLL